MLRKLEMKDASRMYEWMHDEEVIKGLHSESFTSKTLSDCEAFINESREDMQNCHLAIVNEQDEYLGTVSLKMIDCKYKDAEFAIVLRRDAWGKGYAKRAMRNMIKMAFEDYALEEVYWNVLSTNIKAIRLYRNEGYNELKKISKRHLERLPKISENVTFKFFHITRREFGDVSKEVFPK